MSTLEQDSFFGHRLTRRGLLRLGVGTAGAAMLGGLVGACGTRTSTGGGGASATQADAGQVTFLSTQFKPVEEAEKMRKTILADFKGKVDFTPDDTGPFNDRIQAEAKAGKGNISLVGGQHGDFAPFVSGNLLEDLTPLLDKLKDRNFPQSIVDLARLGSKDKIYYIPWAQATYIMCANKKAQQYLPQGASLDSITYAQLKDWGANIQKATGQRRLGFPGGPNGLLHRFFQGYLYPSYTKSSGVVEFKSADAAQMWTEFKEIWSFCNPQSTGYEFMQEPLQSEEVWVAWDHVARLISAVRDRPNDFVMFPAPAAGKGRGYMPVIAGLAIPKSAPNRAGAEQLITYLTEPKQQVATLRELSFFPATDAAVPEDLGAGTKLEADTVKKQQTAKDAVPSLLPVGLGAKGGEFNKVYRDTFTQIVLNNQPAQQVLDSQAKTLQGIMNDSKAPCWAPDPPSDGPCTVK